MYEYQAINKNGKIFRGQVKANNDTEVLLILLHNDLYPLHVKLLTESEMAAHNRLSKLYEFRSKLEGKQAPTLKNFYDPPPIQHKPSKINKIKWLIIIFIISYLSYEFVPRFLEFINLI